MTTINNIPKHWQIKKLGEIFTIERGGSPRPIEEFITTEENGINWIKIGDTKNVVKYIFNTKEKIKPDGVKRSRMVYVDDFILSNSMSFGKPFIMKTAGCIHDGWLVIRKNETIDNNYLYYILSSPLVYQQFSRLAKGSTVKNLNIEAVKQVEIKYPPLPEQVAIVSRIEELFSHLENGKQQLQTAQQQLKVYRQSLLKAAFEGRLTAQWRQEQTEKDYSLAAEPQAKYGDKEGLPEGWKVEYLKDISDSIQYGYTESSSKEAIGPKFLRITDIQENKVDWSEVPYCKIDFETKKRYLLKAGDLVFARTGATVGKSFLIKGEIPEAVFASYLIRVRVNLEINEKYLSYFFHSPNYWVQITEGQVGIGQPNVNGTKLGQLKITIAPLEEQHLIVSELESKLTFCDKMEETISESLQQAEALRQSILKKAFEGKLI